MLVDIVTGTQQGRNEPEDKSEMIEEAVQR